MFKTAIWKNVLLRIKRLINWNQVIFTGRKIPQIAVWNVMPQYAYMVPIWHILWLYSGKSCRRNSESLPCLSPTQFKQPTLKVFLLSCNDECPPKCLPATNIITLKASETLTAGVKKKKRADLTVLLGNWDEKTSVQQPRLSFRYMSDISKNPVKDRKFSTKMEKRVLSGNVVEICTDIWVSGRIHLLGDAEHDWRALHLISAFSATVI